MVNARPYRLLLVLAFSGLVCLSAAAGVSAVRYCHNVHAVKQAVLREDRHIIHDAVEAFTRDQRRAPQSLDDLVQAGYLYEIPKDPVTRQPFRDERQ